MTLRYPYFLAIFLALTASVGCGDSKFEVAGEVTFDSQSVKDGSIVFIATDGEAKREGARFLDGTFTIRIAPGNYRLEVNAQVSSGTRKQIGFDGKEEVIHLTEELFPDYYNVNSTLTKQIEPGRNRLDLHLKKK
ncbi:MAG: hypothetical protein EXS16_20070 [Gemmataceae bacterium]|nr:hypothetical protein [Gemmataceae bacterium]